MSESLKLCLVRCPKCQNLLQELPNYSIYQCGGCGAVLRAKEGKVELNYGSKRFDEERVGVISDESENFQGKDAVFGVENGEGKVSDGDMSNETIAQELGIHEVGNKNLGSKSDKRESMFENSSRFSRSSRFVEGKMSDDLQFRRMRTDHFERRRFSSSSNFEEDNSRYHNQASRSTRPEIVDYERDELLRKLDELKDQLLRVQTMNGKPPENSVVDPRTVEYRGYRHDHVARPPYFEPMRSFNHGYRYEDPQTFIRPQTRRIPSHCHRYMSIEPSCSCHQCYARQLEVPRQIPRFYHDYNVMDVKADPQPHSKKPSVRPRRPSFSKETRCFPIAGGTPFVACHNCFKLLKLPKKMCIRDEGKWNMSCGVCSSVISFAFVDGKLVSLDTSSTSCAKIDDFESCHEPSSSRASRDTASFCSEDYANTPYNDVRTMDIRVSSSSFQEDISISKSEEMNNCSVSSTTTNEDEHLQDELVAINRGGKGSVSCRFDKEKVPTNKTTLRGTSLKGSLASEMEKPLDDYEDQQKGKKGIDSFLAGIIKKSFRDLSRSTGSAKRNVSINGHLIPDRSVKKAEKLAGPIHPGNYWYDYRAGFWGEIGGSCLGIIPSNIQEFNYPMPEKCAGGNTGVIVNGRELHQKDFELLTSRGLPSDRDKSYIVGISGRVVDAYSGKELVNLGKLAPTVEKLRCGFGMRAVA